MDNVKHCKESRANVGGGQGYIGLSVADGIGPVYAANGQTIGTSRFMQTMWKPTAEELAVLNNGGFVCLEQLCVAPPPMIVSTSYNRVEDF